MAYFILDTRRYRGPYVISQANLVVDSPNAFEMALNSSLTRVNSCLIREVSAGREPRFQAGLEFGHQSFLYPYGLVG
jgi:hypothetical protein